MFFFIEDNVILCKDYIFFIQPCPLKFCPYKKWPIWLWVDCANENLMEQKFWFVFNQILTKARKGFRLLTTMICHSSFSFRCIDIWLCRWGRNWTQKKERKPRQKTWTNGMGNQMAAVWQFYTLKKCFAFLSLVLKAFNSCACILKVGILLST